MPLSIEMIARIPDVTSELKLLNRSRSLHRNLERTRKALAEAESILKSGKPPGYNPVFWRRLKDVVKEARERIAVEVKTISTPLFRPPAKVDTSGVFTFVPTWGVTEPEPEPECPPNHEMQNGVCLSLETGCPQDWQPGVISDPAQLQHYSDEGCTVSEVMGDVTHLCCPPDFQHYEAPVDEEEPSFYEKHKMEIFVGGGVLAAIGAIYFMTREED